MARSKKSQYVSSPYSNGSKVRIGAFSGVCPSHSLTAYKIIIDRKGICLIRFLSPIMSIRGMSTIKKNKKSTSTYLEVWGTNLGSTAKYGRLTKQAREMIVLPPYQKSIIVGLLLSDGWAYFPSATNKNARIEFRQSIDKFEYVWFTWFNCLSHYCERYPYSYASVRKGVPYYNLTISTRGLPCFTELYHLFYVNNKKIIPENIYELLTPVCLAHIIMGDGTLQSGGIRICTDSYEIQDIVRLVNVLIIKYGFNCSIHTDRGRFRVYIKKTSMPLLISIVKPHMAPSMLYKLGF